MVYPFVRHVSERRYEHPWVPVQLELKTERFGMAYRLLFGYAFVRRESDQNSSRPNASEWLVRRLFREVVIGIPVVRLRTDQQSPLLKGIEYESSPCQF